MEIVKFKPGDVLKMKKSHPCGASRFTVVLAGSDVKIKCCGCDRDVILPRIKLEKM